MIFSFATRHRHFPKTLLAILLLILSARLHAQVPGGVGTTIYTPMGQSVFAIVNPEDESIRNPISYDQAAQIQANGWWVVVDGAATTRYQCHGYAWSVYAGGPQVEINGDVKKYYTNDAVEEIAPMTQDNWEEGVIIVFGKNMDVPVHSAVTTAEYGVVRSKWWYGSLYRHTVTGHPWGNYEQGWYRVPMNGPNRVCSFGSTTTYSTTSAIPGATYSWKLSGTPVGGNSSSVGIQHFFSPNTNKSLSIEIQCPLSGTTIKSFRPICFGENSGYVPSSYWIMNSQDNATLCPYTSYTLYVYPSCVASNITYTLPPGFTVNYASGSTLSFSTGSGGTGSIDVHADVWCSTSASRCCAPPPGANVLIASAYVSTSNPYCGWSMAVSPNPAAAYIEIETGAQQSPDVSPRAQGTSFMTSEDAGESYQLTVYNSQRVAVFTTQSRDRKIRINTQQVPNGVYIAEVIHGKERITKRFAVNH